ncbi:hypothetical protein [uncultured Actinomyces sp.]|uniref:hypothetical protein n=1 Tax=uncultured Actinomyces sp. TaxID=249061 RepID=UPI0028D3C0A1|nr:hypothetical protein [uncultured Actinomyces sp.]
MSPTAQTKPMRRNGSLWRALVASELRVFMRQPIMIALSVILPIALLGLSVIGERAESNYAWAQVSGRNSAAVMCITVYFVSLNTITARRHTLALKRLRTSALPDFGIVSGLLVPPLLVGLLQLATVWGGMIWYGLPDIPVPASPLLVIIAGVAGVFVAALAGVVTAAVTPNPEKVQWTMMPLFVSTMGAVSILPVLLDPTENLMLRAVPLVANADMIISGWAPSAHAGRILADAAIIVTWLLILGVLSRRTFRWERRR